MAGSAEIFRPQITTTERVGKENHFWPNVIDILQTHDTHELRMRTLQVISAAPKVEKAKVWDTLGRIRYAYKDHKSRKFTGDNEENHSLQVFLVAAELIGLDNLTTDQAEIALGHNLYEDTSLKLDFDSQEVNDGIRILSHKRDGVTLYPKSKDKTEHFIDIVNANAKTEHELTELLTLKLADAIVVGNDPLTWDELKSPEDIDLAVRWFTMSENKQGEMQILQSLVPAGEEGIHRRLREAIAFIQLRQYPEDFKKLKEWYESLLLKKAV